MQTARAGRSCERNKAWSFLLFVMGQYRCASSHPMKNGENHRMFEPVKSITSVDVFKQAHLARREAEAGARIQQARQQEQAWQQEKERATECRKNSAASSRKEDCPSPEPGYPLDCPLNQQGGGVPTDLEQPQAAAGYQHDKQDVPKAASAAHQEQRHSQQLLQCRDLEQKLLTKQAERASDMKTLRVELERLAAAKESLVIQLEEVSLITPAVCLNAGMASRQGASLGRFNVYHGMGACAYVLVLG